jgi:hypothetical protein
MEKKKTSFGETVAADAVWATFQNHILDTLQLL